MERGRLTVPKSGQVRWGSLPQYSIILRCSRRRSKVQVQTRNNEFRQGHPIWCQLFDKEYWRQHCVIQSEYLPNIIFIIQDITKLATSIKCYILPMSPISIPTVFTIETGLTPWEALKKELNCDCSDNRDSYKFVLPSVNKQLGLGRDKEKEYNSLELAAVSQLIHVILVVGI